MDLTKLSLDELIALETEKVARFNEIKGLETLSQDDYDEALAIKADVEAIRARKAELAAEEAPTEATDEQRDELAALSLDEESEEDDEEESEEDEPEVEAAVEEEETVTAAAPEKPAPKRVAKKAVAKLAKTTPRPEVPAEEHKLYTITAAADTQFATGSTIDVEDVTKAAIHRLKGLPEPSGDGKTEDLRYFPVANFEMEFPDDLVIGRNMSEESIHAVLQHAGDESRLDGNSLTASAGWCAPSEIIYDLPNNEIVDGILSLPEVQVNRGGFKHTTGLDWSTLYSGVGFQQTEAEAIAGTTKTCYEVPCPTFVDERLDAIGLCIKVPILLEAGYPEMVGNVTSRSMVAHQYKVNASVIGDVVTAAGAARNFTTDLGSTVVDTLSGLDLVLEQLRQKYRIGQNATLEVVLPVFARSVFRNDLGARNGRGPEAVSDAEIAAHFSVRHANVQYVYGWQELTTSAVVWPTSLDFIAYPAGTFVKGVSNVINLSAVYDAASLAVNIYTGLFMEQGLLVAKMNYEAVRGTVPVCNAGRTGAANLTCA
jgi:hypothetical protein